VRENRTQAPAETACPACGGELLNVLGCNVQEQRELISISFKVIETQRPKLACFSCGHIVQAGMPSKPSGAAMQVSVRWPSLSFLSDIRLKSMGVIS
jgi:transposase